MTPDGAVLVCIVDDDVELRATLKHMLEDAGMRVVETSSGRDGVELAQGAGAAVAIVDIVMPDQEGLETIRMMRLRVPGIRILAMSGYDSRYLEMAMKFGADDAVRKPFGGRELVARVQQLLGPAS
jgi:DNA-binding response OmpR family regulator